MNHSSQCYGDGRDALHMPGSRRLGSLWDLCFASVALTAGLSSCGIDAKKPYLPLPEPVVWVDNRTKPDLVFPDFEIFWAYGDGKVWAANLDGTDKSIIYHFDESVLGLAVDPGKRLLFIAAVSPGGSGSTIYSTSLPTSYGSLSKVISVSGSVRLAVDTKLERLFWRSGELLAAADYDGGNEAIVVHSPDGGQATATMSLVAGSILLCWLADSESDSSYSTLKHMPATLTDAVQELPSTEAGFRALALGLDPDLETWAGTGTLYMSAATAGSTVIYAMPDNFLGVPPDSDAPEFIAPDVLMHDSGLVYALAGAGGWIYWYDPAEKAISRANVDYVAGDWFIVPGSVDASFIPLAESTFVRTMAIAPK